jgi:hypothetical protein
MYLAYEELLLWIEWIFEIWLINLRQESWREPIGEVSERATNDNSTWDIDRQADSSTISI